MTKKNIISFVLALAFVFNIGGIAYLFYDHHYPFAVAAIIVCLVAAKPIWEKFKKIL